MIYLRKKKPKPIRLVRPTAEYEVQVMLYRSEMLENNDNLDGCAALEETETYSEWLDFENRLKKKYGEGYVPSDLYLAVTESGNRLVGMIDYRKVLSPFLLQFGGNCGYSVRPCFRKMGYATEMLKQLTDICREEGVEKILLTCDQNNEASRRTILNNGGVLENEIEDSVGLGESGIIQRYWITL